MPKETFTKNLNYLLAKKKLTQEEFSSKLGMSRTAAGPWVKGVTIPKLKTLIQISDVFGVTVEKLCSPRSDKKLVAMNVLGHIIKTLAVL